MLNESIDGKSGRLAKKGLESRMNCKGNGERLDFVRRSLRRKIV